MKKINTLEMDKDKGVVNKLQSKLQPTFLFPPHHSLQILTIHSNVHIFYN
jgi:hypothetical protein